MRAGLALPNASTTARLIDGALERDELSIAVKAITDGNMKNALKRDYSEALYGLVSTLIGVEVA